MSDITITIIHPTDGRILTATTESSITPEEIISELVLANFISSYSGGYSLAIKGGGHIDSRQTLQSANIKDGDILRVIPHMDAG